MRLFAGNAQNHCAATNRPNANAYKRIRAYTKHTMTKTKKKRKRHLTTYDRMKDPFGGTPSAVVVVAVFLTPQQKTAHTSVYEESHRFFIKAKKADAFT